MSPNFCARVTITISLAIPYTPSIRALTRSIQIPRHLSRPSSDPSVIIYPASHPVSHPASPQPYYPLSQAQHLASLYPLLTSIAALAPYALQHGLSLSASPSLTKSDLCTQLTSPFYRGGHRRYIDLHPRGVGGCCPKNARVFSPYFLGLTYST